MVVNGRELADNLRKELAYQISQRKNKLTLAVLQVGNDEGSTAYIRQKQRKGEEVGISILHKHFEDTITEDELISEIKLLNVDKNIDGIIVQRPLPQTISSNEIVKEVVKEKDVDGFNPNSPFTPPVGLAVFLILTYVYNATDENLWNILRTKHVVLVGRGETAGKPIARSFKKRNVPFDVIHSTTDNREFLLKNADIVISCVGKQVIHKKDVKDGVILIGVGLSRQNGKLIGDYDENEIKDTASYYTPTPGGVGPLTVAFLLKNIVDAYGN
jgi:methylenetetrahydrofolate dehydrogenase (NADP+)/methenyltetrahydrofolate cyclohydrolase